MTLFIAELTRTKRPIMYIELVRVPAMRKKYGYKMSLLRGACPPQSAVVHPRQPVYSLLRVRRFSYPLLSMQLSTSRLEVLRRNNVPS